MFRLYETTMEMMKMVNTNFKVENFIARKNFEL